VVAVSSADREGFSGGAGPRGPLRARSGRPAGRRGFRVPDLGRRAAGAGFP